MGVEQPELGKRQRFEARKGVGGFSEWGGVNKDSDPSGINPWEFQELINVDLSRGSINSRGGQSAVGVSAMSGCVVGLFDLGNTDTGDGTTLLWASSDVLSSGITEGSSGVINDEFTSIGTVEMGKIVAWTQRYIFARYKGDIFFFRYDTNTLENVMWKLSVTSNFGAAQVAATKAFTLPFKMSSSAVHKDVLYISGAEGGVVSWDGQTVTPVLTDTQTGRGTILCSYHETLYYFAPNMVKSYSETPNVWTNVVSSAPAGTTTFVPLCYPTVFEDTLYVGGTDDRGALLAMYPTICTFNGSALTVTWQNTNNVDVGNGTEQSDKWGVFGFQEFNGDLYYVYGVRESGHGDEGHIAHLNGGAYTTIADTWQSEIGGVRSMCGIGEYRGDLCVGTTFDPTFDDPGPVGVGRSQGTNLSLPFDFEDETSMNASEFLVF